MYSHKPTMLINKNVNQTGSNSSSFTMHDCVDHTNISSEPDLQAQDRQLAGKMAPTIAFLAVVMIVGLVGNTVVLVVYKRRFKPSVIRTYVLAMGVCDLLINIGVLPTEVVQLCSRATFTSDLACKVFSTTRCILVVFSAGILVAVAIERQKAVCRMRVNRDVSLRRVFLTLLGCGILVLLLSSPYTVLAGPHTVSLPGNITTAKCSIRDEYIKSEFHVVYKATLNVLFLICVVVMIASYWRIARHLRQHKHQTSCMQETQPLCLTDHQTPSTHINSYGSNVHSDDVEGCASDVTDLTMNSNSQSLTCSSSFTSQSLLVSNSADVRTRSKVHGRDLVKPARTTFMLFILTIIFICNYLPYLTVVTLTVVDPSIQHSVEPNVLFLSLHSFFMNSAVNPFVYSFCSARFRQECRRLFTKCRTSRETH